MTHDEPVAEDKGAVLHKHRKRRDFTQAQNATIRDAGLSFKATGLLVFLLSLPDGAPVGSRELAKQKPDGRHSIMSGFRELRNAGYVRQSNVRTASGQFITVTHVFEVLPGAKTEPGTGRGFPASENRATSLREKDLLQRRGSVVNCGGCGTPVALDDLIEHEETCPGCAEPNE